MYVCIYTYIHICIYIYTAEIGYDRLNGTRKNGPSYAKSAVYICRIPDMHRTGTKHSVRHMRKSVKQWSVISKFTCVYIYISGADPGGGSFEPPLAGESFCTTRPPVDKHQNELFFLPRPPVAIYNSVQVYCFPALSRQQADWCQPGIGPSG